MASVDRGATTRRGQVTRKLTRATQPASPLGTRGESYATFTVAGKDGRALDTFSTIRRGIDEPLVTRAGPFTAFGDRGVYGGGQRNILTGNSGIRADVQPVLPRAARATASGPKGIRVGSSGIRVDVQPVLPRLSLNRGGGDSSFGECPPPRFKMIARDANCIPQPTYRSWVVQGTPDPNAQQYGGPFCGLTKNFVEVWIDATW